MTQTEFSDRLPNRDTHPEARAISVMKIYGDGQPFSKMRAAQGVRDAQQHILQGCIDAGRWFICAKEHLPHGEFVEFAEMFMPKQRVRECMRLAEMYHDTLSPLYEISCHIGPMSKSKALLVASIPERDINKAVQTNILYGRDVLAIGDMSVRETRRFIEEGRRAVRDDEQPGNTVALDVSQDSGADDHLAIDALRNASQSLGEAIGALMDTDWFAESDFFDAVESYIRRLDSQMATIDRLYAEAE